MGNVVVGVECVHCWYWVSYFCEDLGVDFILGHALYMKAIHGQSKTQLLLILFRLSDYHSNLADALYIPRTLLSIHSIPCPALSDVFPALDAPQPQKIYGPHMNAD